MFGELKLGTGEGMVGGGGESPDVNSVESRGKGESYYFILAIKRG